MYLADQRVILQARPAPQRSADFEVVLLGHCGGSPDLSQLRPSAIEAIRSLGLSREAVRLQQLQADAEASELDQRLLNLYHLPLPILNLADFQVLFPQASQWRSRYRSRLAGDHFWLPQAVEAFFSDTTPLATGFKRLWVIRIPEAEGQSGFLPTARTELHEPSALRGLPLALLPPEAALIALPDLERLQIPANLADIPRVRLENPEVTFLPCSHQPVDDGHRERRNPAEMPLELTTWSTRQLLARLIEPLQSHRPDMQCLWTLPLADNDSGSQPSLSGEALDDLAALRNDAIYGRGLHRIQFLYPYLKYDQRLFSASGLLAGQIATQTLRNGAWRSVAGMPLPGDLLPYPPLDQRRVAQLREAHGIGVLINNNGQLSLDDERLAAPYHPKFGQLLQDDSAQRSAELVRLMGFIQRRLQRLGETILFGIDPKDPRPQLLLEQLFNRLHERGALRGQVAEQAYQIRQIASDENTLKYEIEITPAFPIDRILLSFSHERGENKFILNWGSL